ncbi:MAG: hypothetical protein L0Z68_07600, partial [Gammaproteobacteria bacterium]|nr:hypothetical protein [Gammaproteobacteria bacterium]
VDYAHGRIETRTIWTTTALNAYLDFPHVGQAFVIRTGDDRQKDRETLLRYCLWPHQPAAR